MNKVVLAWGRMNPPTAGHELICKAMSNAEGDSKLYLSHSNDKKKNPLTYDRKYYWCDKAFSRYVEVVRSEIRQFLEVLVELYESGYTDLMLVTGSDRSDELELAKFYDGKEGYKHGYYKFDNIEPLVLNRNINEDDLPIERVSASQQRLFAEDDNLEEFIKYCPSTLTEDECEELYNDVRKGMGLVETLEELHLQEENKFNSKKIAEDKYFKRVIDNFFGKGILGYDGKLYKIRKDQNPQETEEELLSLQQGLRAGDTQSRKRFEEIIGLPISGVVKSEYSGQRGDTYVFQGADITFYQESIYGLTLANKIKEADSVDYIEWLRESNPELETGIFKYIRCLGGNYFEEKWNNFIDNWGNTFEGARENRNIFISEANKHLGINVEDSILVSDGVKECPPVGKKLLTKADTYDKSDIYYCSDESVLSELLKLRGDDVRYSKFMEDNQSRIIGVSLKKTNFKHFNVDWVEPVTEEYFEYVWLPRPLKEGANTYTIHFDTKNGKEILLGVKSNQGETGGGTLEFGAKGELGQMGKAVTPFKIALSNYPEYYNPIIGNLSSKRRNFKEAAESLMILLTGKKDFEYNTKYKINNKVKKMFTEVFNKSCGLGATDASGNRITAPYIKVH